MRLATGTLPRQKQVFALLAEDDAVLRRHLKTHLSVWGLTVIEAQDRAHLADVMEIMRKDPGAGIDVIVSELQMLGMGCGEIRSRLHQFHGATAAKLQSTLSSTHAFCHSCPLDAVIITLTILLAKRRAGQT